MDAASFFSYVEGSMERVLMQWCGHWFHLYFCPADHESSVNTL